VIAAVRFALVGGECRERAAELVDLAEQILEAGLDVTAYLVEHGGERSLRVGGAP
jgi:hypothetical protein